MAHIECHSHITGRDVKYSLIGVKLKHKEKQEDYGAACSSSNNYYFNTSPNSENCEYITKLPHTSGYNGWMYTTTGRGPQGYDASGVLEAEYDNSNTGTNPIIASSVHSINEFKSGLNTKDLFETDTVKIVLDVFKCKISETPYKISEFIGIDEDIEILYKVYIRYILKSSNTTIGVYNISDNNNYGMFPITFTINTELFWIKDFNPINKSNFDLDFTYEMWLDSGYSNSGLYVDGIKSETPGDFIGAAFTLLCSEYWGDSYYGTSEYHKYTIKKGNAIIPNSELRQLNNKAGILYYRNKITTNPNEFINLTIQTGNKYTGGRYKNATPTERYTWANNTLNTEGYVITSEGYEDSNDIFKIDNFITTPILLPCINPSTFEMVAPRKEGMFISLTNNILEGPAPDQEPDEDPLDPETLEPADNPRTEYTPQESDGNKEFEYPGMDFIPTRPATLNAYRNSYSNFLFHYFYEEPDTAGGETIDAAIQFITDAANPSAFEVWGATFNLLSGHPTPDEIISRVYYLPFEYKEIRYTEDKTPGYPDIDGTVKAAPVYGPIGPLTMGAKEYTGSNDDTGKPITSNIHYYDMMTTRFKEMDLGTTTITRVFNNFMDYSDVKYTLKLPYGAGDVELDPDFLFMNGISNGTVSLKGYLDFDTGELSIIILVNDHLYHETIVNVAIDRLANVEDKMAGPLAIGKAIAAAAATAGGIAKFAAGDIGIGSAAATAGGGGGSIGSAAATTGNIVRQANNDGSSTYFERKNNDGSSTYFDRKNGYAFFDERSYARHATKMEEILKKYQ